MYEYTDKGIAAINRRIQHEFSVMRRAIASFDEIWLLQDAVNTCYGNIMQEVRKIYLDIANRAYKDATGREGAFTYYWLERLLLGYDPITRYVFAHEYDRKRARTFEAVVATQKRGDLLKELKQAMYNLSVQTKQYADEVTDTATLQGYIDSGIEQVRWITEQDGRVCAECKKRSMKVYPVTAVPVKPHIRCRCWLIPAKKTIVP